MNKPREILTKSRASSVISCIALAFLGSACSSSQVGSDDNTGTGSTVTDISLGSTGPEVTRLREYLTNFGYFPNANLERAYPAWRPIIQSQPRDENEFDSDLEIATRAFQRNFGIEQTGKLDALTRTALEQPRCGVPDNIEQFDSTDKWDLTNSGRWGSSALTWKVINTDGDLSLVTVDALARAALNYWHSRSAYTFTDLTGSSTTADIQISFANLGATTNASTAPISSGGDVTLNSLRTWSNANPTPAGSMDLMSILMHELGHALGLAHSSRAAAVMYPFFNTGQSKVQPTPDDIASISAMNPIWTVIDSGDQDIAYNKGETWVIKAPAITGGFTIRHFNGVNWSTLPGGAVRIAVNSKAISPVPYVVNNGGGIFRYNPSIANWDTLPGCAHDIAIGEDDSVWTIGCTVGPSGFNIQKFDGSSWRDVSGWAVRIAVGPHDPDSADNVPWVVNTNNGIFRRTNSNSSDTSAFWETLPGTATDIAATGGVAWSIGTQSVGGGFNIQVYDEQPAGGGAPPSVARRTWVAVAGGATNISAADGSAALVNNAGFGFFGTAP